MEIEEKGIDLKDIKFDPEQPRKTFDPEEIENLAKTYKTQGIINAPEIDENNVVITGELRVRAAKIAGLKKIKCNVIKGISEIERRERQIIENLHLHKLETSEYEKAIVDLWEKGKKSGKYETQEKFANTIGISESSFTMILKSYRTRLDYDLSAYKLSTTNVYAIHRLNDSYKDMLISQLKAGKTPTDLVSYVSKLKTMPDDVIKQVLKVSNPISAEEGEIVAKFKTPEERKEIMDEIKYTQKDLEEKLTYFLQISKGEIEPLPQFIDIENKTVRYFRNFMLNAKSRFVIEYLRAKLSEESYNACIEYMIQLRDHLNSQLKQIHKKIPIKVIDVNATEG
jgi:ParB family chromosome partitioning protein